MTGGLLTGSHPQRAAASGDPLLATVDRHKSLYWLAGRRASPEGGSRLRTERGRWDGTESIDRVACRAVSAGRICGPKDHKVKRNVYRKLSEQTGEQLGDAYVLFI